MFIDEVSIQCRAGNGGKGVVAWRREKYIPKGGPYGGDGGQGGDIILRTTTNENTLSEFRYRKVITAPDGEKGAVKEMHGANAESVTLLLPVGTIVWDQETGERIVDLDHDGATYVLCRGGRGGYGNAHFASSTRQAPAFAELGDVGEERAIRLELQLVADVGIIGLPNVGKSTLIRAITNVEPKIADYPFTTIIPNLGVMEYKDNTLVIEDVPGLIPGASEGKGLGIQFLRHIERTRLLVHLVDVASMDPVADYDAIRQELRAYSEDLIAREEIIVVSRIDIVDDEYVADIVTRLQAHCPGRTVLSLSAASHRNISILQDALIDRCSHLAPKVSEMPAESDRPVRVYDLTREETPEYTTWHETEPNTFVVEGARIEQIVRMTDMSNAEAVARVYDVLEKQNILPRIYRVLEARPEVWSEYLFEGESKSDTPPANPRIIIAKKEFALRYDFRSKKR